MVRPGIHRIVFFYLSSWLASERCSFVEGFLLWMLYTGRARHPGRGHPSGTPRVSINIKIYFLSSSLLEAGYLQVIWRWNAKPTLWPLLSIDRSLPELEMSPTIFAKLAFRLFGPLPVKMSRLVVMLRLVKFVCMVHLLHFLLSLLLLSRSSFVWSEP